MSKTIKSAEINFKNNAGNYVGVNSVSEKKTSEQIAAIEAKGRTTLNSIPANYTDLEVSIAPFFDENENYTTGDYVYNTVNGHTYLYRFNTNHVAGIWDANETSQVILTDIIKTLLT